MTQSTKTALAVVVVIALGGAFWLLLVGPKREKASELGEQTTTLRTEVAAEQQRAAVAVAAKERFPAYYRQLVLLGKAVPAEAATPSLLVQLNGISRRSNTRFQSISLGGSGGEAGEEGTEATEVTLPIGASPGPAGLLDMPYSLRFEGGFFQIANFVHGIDSLVETKAGAVDAHGRLITIDGFNLAPTEGEEGEAPSSSALTGTFKVSTYVTPPAQGLTAGATAAGPETATSAE